MSAEARSRHPLRELAKRMSGPLPRRTRFLNELSSDLHDLTTRLVEAGYAPAEARRRAEEAMLPDDSSLDALERIHASWYRRFTARVDPGRLARLERGAVVLLTTVLLLTEAGTLTRVALLDDPSPFLWPVLGLGSALVAVALAKAFQLWIKRDHARPRRGLGALPVLVAAVLSTAIGGVVVDAIRLASSAERSPADAATLVLGWLVADAALVSVAILFSLFGGLAWLLTSHWLVHVEDAHERALRLSDSLDPDPPFEEVAR